MLATTRSIAVGSASTRPAGAPSTVTGTRRPAIPLRDLVDQCAPGRRARRGGGAASSSRASSSRSFTSRVSRSTSASRSAVSGRVTGRHGHLELGPQAGQRRAQLVRGVGDERPLSPPGRLQPAEHAVERLGQPADLVGASRAPAGCPREPAPVISSAPARSCLDRSQGRADQPPGHRGQHARAAPRTRRSAASRTTRTASSMSPAGVATTTVLGRLRLARGAARHHPHRAQHPEPAPGTVSGSVQRGRRSSSAGSAGTSRSAPADAASTRPCVVDHLDQGGPPGRHRVGQPVGCRSAPPPPARSAAPRRQTPAPGRSGARRSAPPRRRPARRPARRWSAAPAGSAGSARGGGRAARRVSHRRVPAGTRRRAPLSPPSGRTVRRSCAAGSRCRPRRRWPRDAP